MECKIAESSTCYPNYRKIKQEPKRVRTQNCPEGMSIDLVSIVTRVTNQPSLSA